MDTLMIPIALVGLSIGVIWIWMIIDCVKHEPAEGNTKIAWLLVIVLAGGIGGLIYFFYRRPRRLKEQHEKVEEDFLDRDKSEES